MGARHTLVELNFSTEGVHEELKGAGGAHEKLKGAESPHEDLKGVEGAHEEVNDPIGGAHEEVKGVGGAFEELKCIGGAHEGLKDLISSLGELKVPIGGQGGELIPIECGNSMRRRKLGRSTTHSPFFLHPIWPWQFFDSFFLPRHRELNLSRRVLTIYH